MLAHDIEGSGRPVVLLHSGVCDRRMWQPQWGPLLEAGYRVLRADFRGYGESPAAGESFDNAEDVRDLLDAYDIQQAMLVGSSFGGRIAHEIAARWPDRVSDLALLCAALRGHPPTPSIRGFSHREDELLEAGDVDAATALNVETFLGPNADDATRDLVTVMQRHAFDVQLAAPDVESGGADYDLAAITARTLVVSGDQDLDYFGEIADHLTATIPGARRIALEWAGHLPSLEDPTRLNPVLLDFLAS